MHSLMLGFSLVLLQAFSAMQGFTPNLISCISFYNIYLFYFTGDRTWNMLLARPALRLGGWTPKVLDVASMACLARRLGGWTLQNYSMLTHVKTGGKKNSSLRATTFGSFIPNLGIWIQGSGTAGHLTSTLIFKFLEDKHKKTED